MFLLGSNAELLPWCVQVSTEVVTKFAYLAQTQPHQPCLCPSFEMLRAQEEDNFFCALQHLHQHAKKCKTMLSNLRVILDAGRSPLDQGQGPGPEVQGAAEATAEAAAGLVAETTETGTEDVILAETTADQASHQFGSLQLLVSGSQARLSAESCFASHSKM